MKIVVFGASGKCGAHLVRLARERGHEVLAVARANAAVPDDVPVARGDVLDESFVREIVVGSDTVASGLGMRYAHPWAARHSPNDFVERATTNLIASRPRRLVVISAAGVGDSRAAMNWPMRALLATSNVGVAYADLERAEAALRASDLDWQAVRPTTLTNGARTDRVTVTDRYRATDRIARIDVAAFMLATLEAPTIDDRTPMITTG